MQNPYEERNLTITILLVLGLLTSALLVFEPAEAQVSEEVQDCLEDFEDDAFPNPPSNSCYSFQTHAYSSSGSASEPSWSIQATGGNTGKALKCEYSITGSFVSTDRGCYFNFGKANIDLCRTDESTGFGLEFDFKVTTYNQSGPGVYVGPGVPGALFSIAGGAPLPLPIKGTVPNVGTGALFTDGLATIDNGVWTRLRLDGLNCAAGIARFSAPTQTTMGQLDSSYPFGGYDAITPPGGGYGLWVLGMQYIAIGCSCNPNQPITVWWDNIRITKGPPRHQVFTDAGSKLLNEQPAGGIRLAKLTETTFLTTMNAPSAADLQVYRCTIATTVSCAAPVIVASAGSQGVYNDIAALGAESAIVCWYDQTNGDLWFGKTTNGAQSFTTQRVDGATGNYGAGCRITAPDSNTYVIVAAKSDSPFGIYSWRTTNGGANWTRSTAITTESVWSFALAHASSTRLAFAYVAPGSPTNMRACHSTDAAASWYCSGNNFVASASYVPSLVHLDGDRYAACTIGSGDAWVATTADVTSSTWVAVRVFIGGNTNYDSACKIVPVTSTRWFVLVMAGSGWGPCYRALETKDGGNSYTESNAGFCAGNAQLNHYQDTGSAANGLLVQEEGKAVLVTQFASSSGGLLNAGLYFQKTTVPGATGAVIDAAASAVVSNLAGFDVDTHAGTTVIARTGTGGVNVQTFNGITLGSSLSTVTTGCNRSNGVIAAVSVVAYLHCDDNENPAELRIRSANLGDPFFSDCDDGDVCPQNVPLNNAGVCFGNTGESGLADRTVIDEIADTEDVPLTWDYVTDRLPATADSRALAIAFTTSAGRIGVLQYTATDDPASSNVCDYWAVELANYGTFGNTIDQLCSWRFGTANLIGVVDEQSTARLYQYTPVIRSNGALDGTLTDFPPLGVSNGIGIACAGEYVAIMTQATAPAKNLYVFNITRGSGQPQWSATVETPRLRGVAISGDAKWVGFVDGQKIRIAWTTNGTLVGNITSDNAEHKQLRMSFAGNNLWQAKRESIARYEISVVTGGVKCEALDCTITPVEPPESEVPTQHPLYGKGAIGEKLPGAGNPLFSLMLSVITILGPAALAFKMTGGGMVNGRIHHGSPVIIGSAAFAGMCLAVYAFDFPIAVPIMTSVVAVALIVQRFWHPIGG